MPPQTHKLRPDNAMKRAIGRVPATIKKPSNGQPSKFQIYTVSQLLETFRDPRAVLLEIASTETQELSDKLGCSLMEALGERRLAAQTVLPYVAQKLPVQVDMRHTKAIHLNIVDERQYRDLISIAADTDANAIEAQIIEGIATESALEDGDGTDATPIAEHLTR